MPILGQSGGSSDIKALFREVDDLEEFLQSSKLGSVVVDEADLIHRLKHRFDDSPLNKLCYYQAYQSMDGTVLLDRAA
eukprot:scaffold1264_cov73-Cylindrotheca_fusiformis.AAC.1